MYKLVYNSDLTVNGFYKEGIHHNIPEPNIEITTDLWAHLLSLGEFTLASAPERKTYTIKDKKMFVKTPPKPATPDREPSSLERITFLEEEYLITLSTLLDLDYKIEMSATSLTKAIRKAMTTDNSISRTPYDMMKTLITMKRYNVIDMVKKIEGYHSIDKISDEQKKELNELISI